MSDQEQLIKSVGTVYRFVFGNVSIHKNTLRKKVTTKGISKNRFYQALDKLVASNGLLKDKENLSINPAIIKTGILQKEGDEYFVYVEDKHKKYPVKKSIAASYQPDDLMHVIIEPFAGKEHAIILGKKIDDDYKAYIKRKKEQKNQKEEKEAVKGELGTVMKLSHDNLVFIPRRKDLPRQIPILNDKEEWAMFQDKLCVMQFVNPDNMAEGGRIVQIKCDARNPIAVYEAIAESVGAIMSWTGEKLEKEIEQIPTKVNVEELDLVDEREFLRAPRGKTVDLRHLDFSTVDPKKCKDMDDAVYTTFDEKGNPVVYTAVANVTKYVDLAKELGMVYVLGGFTFYTPTKAYNILHPKLSTNICSFNEDEDRLAFVIKTTLDPKTGKVKDYKILDSVIRSRKKYSYNGAQEILDLNREEFTYGYLKEKVLSGQPLSLEERIVLNAHGSNVARRAFEARGMVRFAANNEREIIFDDSFEKVVDIVKKPHLFYEDVIETDMIVSNEGSANFAIKNGIDIIYRIHEEPNPRKRETAEEFFNVMGIEFDGDLSASGIDKILEKVKGTPEEDVVNEFLIKMQSRAIYSDRLHTEAQVEKFYEENGEEVDVGKLISHYALQSTGYSHTTAPIRRICDYVTQYNILAFIHGTKPLSKRKIESIVRWANEKQIDIDMGERQLEDATSALYAEMHIGKKMKGTVSRFRYTTPEDDCDEEILVEVKNDETGVRATIPLSQVIGRKGSFSEISRAGSCVYDANGNVILTLCKPVDFIISGADVNTATVYGKTDKIIVDEHENTYSYISGRTPFKMRGTDPGIQHDVRKHSTEMRKQKSKQKDRERRDRERDDL